MGCPGLRLLEEDIQHVRLEIVRHAAMADALTLGPTYSRPKGGRVPSPWSTRPPSSLLAALFSHILMQRGLRFAATTGGMLVCRPPVTPSVAASKHTSARIETCFKGTTTDINNA